MAINQSGIRSAVKFTVFVLFLVGVGWRLYEIIRFGGKKDKSQPKQEDQDDETAEDESGHDSESDSPSPMMESKSTLAGSVKLR